MVLHALAGAGGRAIAAPVDAAVQDAAKQSGLARAGRAQHEQSRVRSPDVAASLGVSLVARQDVGPDVLLAGREGRRGGRRGGRAAGARLRPRGHRGKSRREPKPTPARAREGSAPSAVESSSTASSLLARWAFLKNEDRVRGNVERARYERAMTRTPRTALVAAVFGARSTGRPAACRASASRRSRGAGAAAARVWSKRVSVRRFDRHGSSRIVSTRLDRLDGRDEPRGRRRASPPFRGQLLR